MGQLEIEWLVLPRNSEPSLKLDHSNCGQPVLMEYLLSLILIFYLHLHFPGLLSVSFVASHLESFMERAKVYSQL
jgi:hypothetical protein